MKIIATATMKGGVGKTTFTFNFAGTLAASGKHVLLIDADPQANLSDAFGVDIADTNIPSILNIFTNPTSMDPRDIVIPSPIPELPELDLICSNIYLQLMNKELYTRPSKEHILAYYFEDNKDFFEQYDYILIDVHPDLSNINENVFYAATDIILVTSGSFFAYQGMQLFQKMWDEDREALRKPQNISAVVINEFDKRKNACRDIYDLCTTDGLFSDICLKTYIPVDSQLEICTIQHKPVIIKKGSRYKTSKAFIDVVKELEERGVI